MKVLLKSLFFSFFVIALLISAILITSLDYIYLYLADTVSEREFFWSLIYQALKFLPKVFLYSIIFSFLITKSFYWSEFSGAIQINLKPFMRFWSHVVSLLISTLMFTFMTIANEPAKIYQTPNGYHTKTGIKLDKDSMVKMSQGFIFTIAEEAESPSGDEYDVLEVKENLLSGKITRRKDLKQVIERCNQHKETALKIRIALEHKVKPLQDADNFKRAYLNYLEHHDLWQALPKYIKEVHLGCVNNMAADFSKGFKNHKDTNLSLLFIDAVRDFATLLLKEEGRYKSSPYYDRWVFDRKEGQEQYEKIKNVIAECDKHIKIYLKYLQENN